MSSVATNNSVVGAQSVAGSSSSAIQGNSTMDKDTFLKLLVEQLKNQDPLSPMDNSQFVEQMATFSSVEQQIAMNANLGLIQVAQLSQANAQAADLVGKTVTAAGRNFEKRAGTPNELSFKAKGAYDTVKVTIKNQNGAVIRTFEAGAGAEGMNRVQWDGKDENGIEAPPGDYSFSVECVDAEGNAVSAQPYIKGVVEEVSFEKGYAELLVNGQKVKMGDIISISSGRSPHTRKLPLHVPTGHVQGAIQNRKGKTYFLK